MTEFLRPWSAVFATRLAEPRRFLQVVTGPRQVGKTTLVRQVVESSRLSARFASADEPTLRGSDWIEQQWEAARLMEGGGAKASGAVLVLDEIQKIPGWSETVKRLWDEDTRMRLGLKVVVLGSAPLLVTQGLGDSLAGRFEVLHLPHWSFAEMRSAFGTSIDEYLFFGGYPGAAPLMHDAGRWARYVLDALIETSVSRDVLLLTRVDKPALMRRLFDLASRYSGQVLSYTKMLGQLQDAGNATTLAHYLDLLAGAGMVRGLQKYAGDVARQRGSSPKLLVLNTALMTAVSGLDPAEARADTGFWGRLTESSVGAHLANAAAAGSFALYYWQDRNREVDFVAATGRQLTAIEVKSGRAPQSLPGLAAFKAAFRPQRTLLVGGDGIRVEDFLSRPAIDWVKGVDSKASTSGRRFRARRSTMKALVRSTLLGAALCVALPDQALPQASPNKGLTAVQGLQVGHHVMPGRPTGCTVVLTGAGIVGSVDVRGGAPATKETALLDPVNLVQVVHAVTLSGGSAFGLDAVTGVMQFLEERGIGFDTRVARVPIVPAASLFDLAFGGDAKIRPNAECGYKAASVARDGPVAEGNVGAGAGATVGKTGGPGRSMKAGIGSSAIELPDGLVVAALVAVNAVGDIIDPATGRVVAGVRTPDGKALADARTLMRNPAPPAPPAAAPPAAVPRPGQNTTIGVVATNARLTKVQAQKMAQMAHDGYARAINPVHTPSDGDTVFSLATGRFEGEVSVSAIGALAAEAMAEAIVRAATQAEGSHGVPAARDLGR